MTLSFKEIRSRFNPKIVQIAPMGWVESHEHLIGKLLVDPSTGKMYFRTNVNVSNEQVMLYRNNFLAKFRHTQQLRWYNYYFNTFGYVVELHGFIKDM